MAENVLKETTASTDVGNVSDNGNSNASNNVIFIHPDGTGVSDWNAARFFMKVPDGRLNWDTMSNSYLLGT